MDKKFVQQILEMLASCSYLRIQQNVEYENENENESISVWRFKYHKPP